MLQDNSEEEQCTLDIILVGISALLVGLAVSSCFCATATRFRTLLLEGFDDVLKVSVLEGVFASQRSYRFLERHQPLEEQRETKNHDLQKTPQVVRRLLLRVSKGRTRLVLPDDTRRQEWFVDPWKCDGASEAKYSCFCLGFSSLSMMLYSSDATDVLECCDFVKVLISSLCDFMM